MSGDLQNRAAQMLLVGFCKHWSMSTVANAVGHINLTDNDNCARLHERAPCLPSDWFEYRRPARAFVLSQWPKLGAYLLKHENDRAKVLALIPQVERLTCKAGVGRATSLHSSRDRYEAEKARREARIQRIDYELSRTAYKSNQRNAWNVCKR